MPVFFNTTGAGNTSLGYLAGPSLGTLSNATAIGIRSVVSQDNSLVLGAIFGVNGATANTNVGIRTTAPQHTLHVNSRDAAKIGGGPWIAASDNRLKKDVEEFTDGAEMLEKVKPVWFRYNGKAGIASDERYVGVIAQDMQKIAPYTVGEFVYQNETGQQEKYLEFDGNALTYMLINAVKQQNQQITALQNEITQIKQVLSQQTPATPFNKPPTGAELWQNNPNPLEQSTIIRYFVPETATAAQLKFYAADGKEVHTVTISQKGLGEINLSNKQFSDGVYIYRLLVDGKSIASKKLVVSR